MARALAASPHALTFEEAGEGRVACHPERFGDVVLARKDAPASYHLCVTHDDALQGVTLVTRGADLQPATHLHRAAAGADGLAGARLRAPSAAGRCAGRRLAKRDQAATLRDLRVQGRSPAEARGLAEAGQTTR